MYDHNVRKVPVCLMLCVSTDGSFCNILSTTRMYLSSVILQERYDLRVGKDAGKIILMCFGGTIQVIRLKKG